MKFEDKEPNEKKSYYEIVYATIIKVNEEVKEGVDEEVVLDNTSENSRWISLDPNRARANGEDKYVLQGLLRLESWNPGYHKS